MRPLPDAFLDLGMTPLANSYVRPESADQAEATYILAVAYCPGCHLVQLTETVAPDRLFSEYLYFSSYSESFLAHARAMVETLASRFALSATSRILEVASNDGYLLQFFRERGVPVLGIEPARNIAAEAVRRGIPTWNMFFDREGARRVREEFGAVDVLIGNNVLAHVPTINDFLEAVRVSLKEDGIAVFEFPYLPDLLGNTEFDTIYHEHVFYYSASALRNVARRAGLSLFDVSHQPVHGGSLRVFLAAGDMREVSVAVRGLLADEERQGILSAERYHKFSERVGALKTELVERLRALKAGGARIAAYGAPAKGNTLLNTCGIGTDLIEFTVDRSPHKQGLLLPGSRIPILHPSELIKRQPDVTLILPWNIATEIVAQQRDYLAAGGKFMVPVPHPTEVAA